MVDEQAAGGGQTTRGQAAAGRAKVGGRRKPAPVAWGWYVFWKTRSGWRTVWGLILAIPALLAVIYLALPQSAQATIIAAVEAAGQALGASGLRVGIDVALVGCTIASVMLLLAPGYRQYRYLHLPTSVIPDSTYLLDFENMAGNLHGELLLKLMLKQLRSDVFSSRGFSQRRADLLYFMNARHLTEREIASQEGKGRDAMWLATQKRLNAGYTELYLNGFQLVNSPHKVIPGQDEMKEAVDRAIELFALERGLLGGFQQKFVIISGDGDYAPLIYRLVALGHEVEVWMWGKSKVYTEVKKRVPLTVIPLLTPEQEEALNSEESLKSVPGLTVSTPDSAAGSPAPQHVEVTQPGLKPLYEAIYLTVAKYRSLAPKAGDRAALLDKFSNHVNQDATLRTALRAVGYDGQSSVGAWIRTLSATGALGDATPEQAARLHRSVALAAANALTSTPANPEGRVDYGQVLNMLATLRLASADTSAVLATLLANSKWRSIDVRFLELCARVLRLVEFSYDPSAPSVMSNPRLTALGKRIIAEESEGQPEPPVAPEPPEPPSL